MLEIVELKPEHYLATARLHERLLPWSFMARSGAGFLVEFYRGMIAGNAGFAYVALLDGSVVGFVMGTCDRHLLIKKIIKNNFTGIAFSLMPLLLGDFTKLKTIYEIWRSENKKNYPEDYPAAQSLFVAVAPEIKKGTLFYQLMFRLNNHFLEKDIMVYSGRVLKSNPIYEVFKRMPGFKILKEAEVYGLLWVFYTYDIRVGYEDFKKIASFP